MKKRNGYLLAAVISVALFSYIPTSAEDGSALVAGITEGPDPIPHVVWAPIDTFFPSIDFGSGRSDGRPDITEDSEGNPVITWIRRQGIARNVALLRWDGSAWLPVEFVTSGITERKDPRSQSKSADYFHVVWWVSGAIDRVYHTEGRPGAFGPARIVAEDARRPSVLQVGMSVHVAYERTTFSGTQEVVVAVRSPGDAYLATPLFAVQRVGPLDIVIHEDGGRIWMDWKSSDTQMSYSTLADGVWSAPESVSWNEPSWAGSEAARAKIREIVLAP